MPAEWFDIMKKMPEARAVVRVMSAAGEVSEGQWRRPYWYGAEGEWPAPFGDVQQWQYIEANP